MGGAVSSGENNDELVDNLVEAEYIKSVVVEKIFRAVDRADYYLLEHREAAYRDLAWKHGNIHLSAPCIYAEVLEYLKLEDGMSFLNIGSGTSYLSTLAGLVLGPYGINHGIELHKDVIEYAMERQKYFKTSSVSFDEFEYCDPQFVHGNSLLLMPGGRLYDRVYCGAACPAEHENYMKNLVRVGGILVMPLNDQVTRTSETTWETCCVLPVSFATLIVPSQDAAPDIVQLPDRRFLTLHEICRVVIRGVLRKNTLAEHPDVKGLKRTRKAKPQAKKRRRFTMLPMSMFGSVDNRDSDEDESRLAVAVYNEEEATSETGRERGGESEEEGSDPDMSDALQRVLEHRLRRGPWRGHRVVHHHDWPMDAGDENADQGIEEDMEDNGRMGGDVVVQPPSPSTSSEDMDSDSRHSFGDTLPITVPSGERRQRCSSGTSGVSASYTSGVGTCSSVDEQSDVDKTNGYAIEQSTNNVDKANAYATEPSTNNVDKANAYATEQSTNDVDKANGYATEQSTNDASSSNSVHIESPARDVGNSDRVRNWRSNNISRCNNGASDETVTVRRRHRQNTVSLSSCDEEEDEDVEMDADGSASRSPRNGVPVPRMEDEERNEARINFKKCLFEKVDLLPIPCALKQYLLFYRT